MELLPGYYESVKQYTSWMEEEEITDLCYNHEIQMLEAPGSQNNYKG
jgi:hypothetical protein